jgi:KDO2-lipid IV(A) lauroyltransferase
MTRRRRGWRAVGAAPALALGLPFGWLIAHLPAAVGLWVGRRLGDLGWLVLRGRRRVALRNLARAFEGDRPIADRQRLGRRSFEHLGMNIVEACVFAFRPTATLLSRVDMVGIEHLEKASAEGRGILLLTAHLGNWELLAASHALTAFGLSVVVRPLDDVMLDRVVERFRRRSGVALIPKRGGLRQILDALRRGRMVGVLLDQNASRGEGVFAPFFGTPASTSRSLALVSLRSGAPVVPVFIRRLPDGRHRVEIESALPFPVDGDVAAYTAAFNRSIEDAIRRAPDQWFWLHERWRTRPRADVS